MVGCGRHQCGIVHVCFQLVIGSCDGTEHDVIIFGHDVINFGHKNYYKVDHGRIQCRGNVRSSLEPRNTNGWIIQAPYGHQITFRSLGDHFELNFDDFWLAGLGFHLSEPQKSQFHTSGDEKHKVEHLSFLKHPKLLPKSS